MINKPKLFLLLKTWGWRVLLFEWGEEERVLL